MVEGVTVTYFADEVIMLPCEFCEELYPAEDLILHQVWYFLGSRG